MLENLETHLKFTNCHYASIEKKPSVSSYPRRGHALPVGPAVPRAPSAQETSATLIPISPLPSCQRNRRASLLTISAFLVLWRAMIVYSIIIADVASAKSEGESVAVGEIEHSSREALVLMEWFSGQQGTSDIARLSAVRRNAPLGRLRT